MGFPIGYPQLLPSKLFLHILSIFILLRKFVVALSGFLGLAEDCSFFLEHTATLWEADALLHHNSINHSSPPCPSTAFIPVVMFSELSATGDGGGRPESCTVCLHEFEGDDEIMLPMNCRHVFHKSCLNRWIGYNHRMCPLCRSPLVTDDAVPENNVGRDDVLWMNWHLF